MNRTDFMTQLERLLQSISPSEREEALQYYNDYFDDAGAENEQAVIEALGNPARVAENIKRDLPGSAGESPRAKVTAQDRAVIEYGKADSAESKAYFEDEAMLRKESPAAEEILGRGTASGLSKDVGYGQDGSFNQGGKSVFGGSSGQESMSGRDGRSGMDQSYGQAGTPDPNGRFGSGENSGGASCCGGAAGKPGKRGMAGWLIVLIAIGVIFGSPLLIGALSILFGLLVTWFVIIFAFGIATLSLFIVLVALLAVGIQCMFVDPLVGMALIGAGMVCGGMGILFLMLTVALAGIVTPAILKGIGWLLRGGTRHGRKKEATA